jgi:uncharacterized protein YcfJ
MPFAGQFTKASGSQQVAATGLTVTATVKQVKLSDNSLTTLVSGGSAFEVGGGVYGYTYSGTLDFTTYYYAATFHTADTAVQAQDVAAAYFDFPLSLAKDAAGRVDVGKVAGTAQTARDLGANLDAAVSSRSTFAGGAVASVTGDVAGKVLGGGAGTITGTGARVVDGGGNAVANEADLAAVKAKTDNLPTSPAAVGSAMTLTSGERDSIAAALLDLANGVEAGLTPRQFARLAAAVLLGKSSGGGAVYRDTGDTKDRVTATMDGSGNRVAVTRDPT